MKKFLTISLALVLAIGVNAKVKSDAMTVQRNAPSVSANFTKTDMKAQPINAEKLSTPQRASETGLKRSFTKAEGDPYFEKPLGTFYQGLSPDFYAYSVPLFLFAPAYTNIQFIASSPESGYVWTYVDPENPDDGENENFLTSTEQILNLDYGNIFYATPPNLSVRTDTCFQSLYYYNQGGPASYTDSSDGTQFMATNHNPQWGTGYNFTYVGANDEDANAYYTSVFSEQGLENICVKGFAEYLPYLGTPYLLNGVYMPVYCPEGGEVTLAVYKATANEDGTLASVTDEVLATGTFTLEEEDANYQMVKFEDLIYEDPETGDEEELIVTSPIVVSITAEEAHVAPTFGTHEFEHTLDNHALQVINFDYEGANYTDFIDANDHWTSGWQSEWRMGFDIYNYYLHNNESTDTFNAPAEGGEMTFNCDSYYASGAWDITTPDYDDLPDWVTVEPEDSIYLGSDGETYYYSGITNVKVTVAALPEGVESRTADIMLSYFGFKCILHVVQPGQDEAPAYYLVGNFNSWSTTEGMLTFVEGETAGVYEVAAEFAAGDEFKVITPNGDGWTWYGGVDENGVGYFLINDDLMNVGINMVDGANFRMEKAGKYTLQINTADMTLTVVPDAAPAVPGDVDGDGFCTAGDITALYNWLLDEDDSALVNGDQDGDGYITSGDVTFVYDILLN